MKLLKYLIGSLVLIFGVFQIYLFVFTDGTNCRYKFKPVFTIDTIRYGNFEESIPQSGIITRREERLFAKVEIDRLYLSRISKGLTGSCIINNKVYELKISKVYPVVENGRFNVEMDFDEQIPDSLVNDPVRLRIRLSEPTNAILLPVGGFYMDSRGKWIFVINGTNAVKKKIKLGRKDPDYFEVLEGLKSGDKVVTSSYELFKDLDSIDVLEMERQYEGNDSFTWLPWF